MTKNAYVIRRHSEGGIERAEGSIIRDMAPNQFDDFVSVGLVREATAAEASGRKPSTAQVEAPEPETADPENADG